MVTANCDDNNEYGLPIILHEFYNTDFSTSPSLSGVQTDSFCADLKHAWRERLFHTKENIGQESLKFAI